MMSFQEIFNEVIPPTERYSQFGYQEVEEKCRVVAERYAQEVANGVRIRCAENAYVIWELDGHEDQPLVNERLILNTEIILP